MIAPAIRSDGLGKRYRIGSQLSAVQTLRETIAQLPTRLFGAAEQAENTRQFVWALHNLTFSVGFGEVVGVVGSNGSGKSTLLRLASGITEPTEGWVATKGRVATILEVGAGFHPDLTGRENIFLSGIILGMKASEVRRRFTEIVDFAEMGRFIDTPVKHYSTGMYMRLAFAVAAHVEAGILLIDEVLAVGDLSFQEKCLAKIGAARAEGRAVLFVTHNVSLVRRLCTRAILLEQGRLVLDGSPETVVQRYEGVSLKPRPLSDPIVALPIIEAEIGRGLELRLFDEAGRPSARFSAGTHWRAHFDFVLDRPAGNVEAGLTVTRIDGTKIVRLPSVRATLREGGYTVEFVCDVPLAPVEAVVSIELSASDASLYRVEDAAVIEICHADGTNPSREGLVVATREAAIVPMRVGFQSVRRAR